MDSNLDSLELSIGIISIKHILTQILRFVIFMLCAEQENKYINTVCAYSIYL